MGFEPKGQANLLATGAEEVLSAKDVRVTCALRRAARFAAAFPGCKRSMACR